MGNFSCSFCGLLTVLKTNFFFQKIYFRNTIRVSNGLDPDQEWHSVGPDLRQNFLQSLSINTKYDWSSRFVDKRGQVFFMNRILE